MWCDYRCINLMCTKKYLKKYDEFFSDPPNISVLYKI